MSGRTERTMAVAIRYGARDRDLPVVTARGQGPIALQILELAARHGIPVRPDAPLASILAGLDPGMQIPAAAFGAVAEILAFLYRVDRDGAAAGTP